MDIATALIAAAEEAAQTLPLTTIGIIIMVAIAFGVLAKKIGQNQVLGFIVAGFILGPFWLSFLHPTDPLTVAFGEMGLFVLLFYLGLELSIKDFIKAGSTAVVLALVDMVGSIAIGFAIVFLLGYSWVFSIIVGIMMFSTSTVIVAKFAIDRKIIQQVPVKIALSILILQDFLGIMLLVFITSMSAKGSALGLGITALIFAVAVFTAVYKLSSIVQKWLEDNEYGQTEVTLYALGIGLITATVGSLIGLSTTLGAYFAGFALAETKAGHKIKEDVGFLRDFFLVFFFVSFGTTLFYDYGLGELAFPAIEQLIFLVLLGSALAACALFAHIMSCGFFGHRCGLNAEDSSTAAVLLLPLGEFVVIISTAAVKVLQGNEKFLIAPLAFLLIMITVVLFQPLYNARKIVQRFIEMLPVKREIKHTALAPTTPETIMHLQSLAINLFVILCLGWITVVLYRQIPALGVPIPYGRLGVAIIAFAFFAGVPFWNSVKAFKKLYAEVTKNIQK